jgi:hypothetical protein
MPTLTVRVSSYEREDYSWKSVLTSFLTEVSTFDGELDLRRHTTSIHTSPMVSIPLNSLRYYDKERLLELSN